MKPLKIKYIDGMHHCTGTTTYHADDFGVIDIFHKHFDVQFSDDTPDLVMSNVGMVCDDTGNLIHEHLHHDCIKIIYSLENGSVNSKYADICIVNTNTHAPNCFHMSDIVLCHGINDLMYKNKRLSQHNTPKQKFCAFMYSNPACIARNVFCKKLMHYKFVDCLGWVYNNTPLPPTKQRLVQDWQLSQLDIYQEYKFVIAFENSSADGYITEKIIQPLLVGAIPIYWGANDIKEYINPDCFINVNDFESFADCIAYVKQVDTDPQLYQKYLNAPPILPDSKLYDQTLSKLEEWLISQIKTLLATPDRKIGKISKSEQKQYYQWFANVLEQRSHKQRWLHNVPMPRWQKIYYGIKHKSIKYYARKLCKRVLTHAYYLKNKY